MPYCVNCGTEVLGNFCKNCGSPAQQPVPQAQHQTPVQTPQQPPQQSYVPPPQTARQPPPPELAAQKPQQPRPPASPPQAPPQQHRPPTRAPPTPKPQRKSTPPPQESSSKKGVMIGAIIVVIILVIASLASVFIFILPTDSKDGGDENGAEGESESEGEGEGEGNKAPIAKFSLSSTKTYIDSEFFIDPSESIDEDGSISKYKFDFGDGNTNEYTNSDSFSYKYSKEGNYKITLIVVDNQNKESQPYSKTINALNVVNTLLVYDPSGSNIQGSSRSDNIKIAYLVNIVNGQYTNSSQIEIDSALFGDKLDENKPLIINGTFKTSENNGKITVTDIFESIDRTIKTGNFMGMEFENIKAELSSISIVALNHTFGFGYSTEGEPIAYISLDKKPTFFTNISIEGLVLPKNVAEAMDMLNANLGTEFKAFKDAFSQFTKSLRLKDFDLGLKIILADEISYLEPESIEGDVIDVITPKDISKFISAISEDVQSDYYSFITDILDKLDMELIIMTKQDITMKNIEMWLIVGITDLKKDMLKGLVNLEIKEIKKEDIERELGIDLPDAPKNQSLKIKFGVCGEENYQPSLDPKEVRDLWSIIGSSDFTAAKGVNVTGFTFVMSLEDVITYMEGLFKTDLNTLKALTTVRNPGVGLIIDNNFAEVLDNDNKPFHEYFSLGLFPDVQLDNKKQVIYYTTIEGVVYDLGKFLDNKDFTFPVIISDSIKEGPSPTQYTLKDIYNGSLDNQTLTAISVEGFATGTTMKTVAKYAAYVPAAKPVAEIIKKSPIDFCAYEMYEPNDDGNRYHIGLFGLNKTKVDETGPTYFIQKVKVDGFYVSFNKFKDRILSGQSLGKDISKNGSSLITQIFDVIGKITGDYLITNGVILGYKIIPITVQPEIKVTNLTAYSPISEDNKVQFLIEGKVINKGSGQFLPKIQYVITPKNGGAVITKDALLGDEDSWVPAVYLFSGASTVFKYEEEFNLNDFPLGHYDVDIYIFEFSNFKYEKKIGEAHTSFRVFNLNEIGLQLNVSVNDYTWDNYINLSLNLSKVVSILDNPIVIHWVNHTWLPLPGLKEISIMYKGDYTDWELYEKWYDNWLVTDHYVFRIIIEVEIDNNYYILITKMYEISES